MRYTAIVVLDTDLTPKEVVREICSTFEFTATETNTSIESCVVLTTVAEQPKEKKQ